jgi:hypothetical protein
MLRQTDPTQPPKLEWVTVGTGFFYAYLTEEDLDPAKRKFQLETTGQSRQFSISNAFRVGD